jgi:hypothetical protein
MLALWLTHLIIAVLLKLLDPVYLTEAEMLLTKERSMPQASPPSIGLSI